MGSSEVKHVVCIEDTAVPLLDVRPQNGPLQTAIERAMARVCGSGQFVHGPECRELEEALAGYTGVRHAVGCASGSDALLLALMVLGVGAGDEVILPSFTFFATAGSVWRLGARPVFVDIEPRSLNIDPASIEAAITPATRAIIPVHLFGRCAEMGAILEIANRRGLPVVEDAAQAIGAEHAGRRAGSMGSIGCLSFYPTKNLGGFGDGGMLLTNNQSLADRLRILRDHGQNPRYHHSVVGVNSRLDTLQAAVLCIKLPGLDGWIEQRIANALLYNDLFRQSGLEPIIDLPPSGGPHRLSWNQYTIRVPGGQRDALADHLKRHQIGTAIYYPLPLHLQQCFASLGHTPGSLPETERAAQEVLSLPIYPGLSDSAQRTVVGRIAEFFGKPATGGQRCCVPRPKMLDRRDHRGDGRSAPDTPDEAPATPQLHPAGGDGGE